MSSPADWLAIDWMLAAIAAWIAIGAAGILRPHNFFVVARVLFPLGALVGLGVAAAALAGLLAGPEVAVLPLGLPGLPQSAEGFIRTGGYAPRGIIDGAVILELSPVPVS